MCHRGPVVAWRTLGSSRPRSGVLDIRVHPLNRFALVDLCSLDVLDGQWGLRCGRYACDLRQDATRPGAQGNEHHGTSENDPSSKRHNRSFEGGQPCRNPGPVAPPALPGSTEDLRLLMVGQLGNRRLIQLLQHRQKGLVLPQQLLLRLEPAGEQGRKLFQRETFIFHALAPLDGIWPRASPAATTDIDECGSSPCPGGSQAPSRSPAGAFPRSTAG